MRISRFLPLAVTLGVEMAAVVVVVALRRHPDIAVDWGHLDSWLRNTSPESVLASAAFHVGAAATGWLLLATLAYLAARMLRMGRIAATLGTATLPIVRRAVDRTILVVATTATLAAPAAALGQESTELMPPGTKSIGYDTAAQAVETAPPPPPTTAADRYVVRRGDSFWRIAAARVAPSSDVAGYWVRLVNENRGSLRSGNPDLIYPGEAFVLPPLDDKP